MKMLLSTLCIAILGLTGCKSVKHVKTTDTAVAEFHRLFSAEDYEKIFSDAHDDFKNSQPKEDTIAFIRSVRNQLGVVKSTKKTGFQTKFDNVKTEVVLTFHTKFELGAGTETFTYRIVGDDAILLHWLINADTYKTTNP